MRLIRINLLKSWFLLVLQHWLGWFHFSLVRSWVDSAEQCFRQAFLCLFGWAIWKWVTLNPNQASQGQVMLDECHLPASRGHFMHAQSRQKVNPDFIPTPSLFLSCMKDLERWIICLPFNLCRMKSWPVHSLKEFPLLILCIWRDRGPWLNIHKRAGPYLRFTFFLRTL